MIYHLAQHLKQYYSFFNLFHYISFRAITALLSSIFFSLVFGGWFIRKIASQDLFKSKPREWTPDSHLTKSDTPTMGGIFVLMVCFFNTMLWNNLTNVNVWMFLLCIASFGLVGFLDDFYKMRIGKGISARLKLWLQIVSASIVMVAWFFVANPNTELCVPFYKWFTPELGIFIIPWGVFLLVATSNAVNLTDGLDGLAAGPLMANFATFSVIAYLAGHKFLANYLNIPYTGGMISSVDGIIPFAGGVSQLATSSSEIAIVASTLVGAMMGFLWYNTYPAQIFMGDVGSLALGAGLAFMALITRQELLLPIVGGIFVLETLSVIIQVVTFKLCGKRMFRMAPIHHHFELLGWKEIKITVRFWIISIILSLITLLTLKIR